MSHKNLLKILFIEDRPSDVELAVRELRKENLSFEFITVCTSEDLKKALREFEPDLIISDYMMPEFNGLQALQEVRQFNPELPFILYTGSINEETAVECIKAGAQDYVIKEHITRLPYAVKESLEQVMINKEKRASELLLRENEEKLQSIFRAAPFGIGLMVNRVFIEINDSFCTLTGYTRKELIGKSSEIIYSSSEEFINAGKEKYHQIKEKGIGSVETKIKRKDGNILNVLLSSAPLDKNDHSKGVTFIVFDITQRKQSEKALKESQQLFQTLSQVSPVGIFRTNPEGFTTYVNPRWIELSGLTYEDAIGFGWLKAIYPDDREQLEERWNSDVHSQKSSVAEYRFLRPDGSVVWVIGNAVPELINGGIAGYIGTVTDITERKMAEDALIKSETKYRMIFENVQDLYYETSLAGTILTVSPSIEPLSRGLYRQEDVIGKSMYDFYADANERKALISQIMEKGTISDFEITLITRNGTKIPCSVSAKICFDAQGHPEKIIGSMRDITDRKNVSEALRVSKEKAEASDKLKTEFLNNISHEVRTPLNGILGFAEIMSQPDLSEEDKRDSMIMLNESSDRLLNTITNYMDISLITSGSLSVHKKDFAPGTILKRIYDRSKPICANKHIELFLEIPDQKENILINSDPEIFHKIISHLMNNAIKFTEKGSIRFGYNVLIGEVEFFVKDSGIGIGEESIEHIFKRFIKEDRGPAKLTEGSGLGLSIAHGMSEVIGGKIKVESKAGEGSYFFLTIPLKEDVKTSASSIPDHDFRKVISGSLILVAEDDQTNYYYLNALLIRETGAVVLHAANGREAIELYKANPGINLILMDIKMPEIDGLEATRQIKLLNKNVPIIAITAYAMSGDEDKVIEAGCDGYLSKPINKKTLLEKVKEFIKVA